MEPDRLASTGRAERPPEAGELPKAVTVIGAVWLILGVLRFFGGLLGLILWKVGGMKDLLAGPKPFSGLPMERVLRWAFRNFGVEVTVQMLVGLAVVVCAVGLLRRHPWARPAVETLCWLGLIFIFCFSVFWVFLWTNVLGAAAAEPPSMRPLSVGLTLLINGVVAFAFVAMIRALRRPDVRAVFRKARDGRAVRAA